jgi:hypothetical protein
MPKNVTLSKTESIYAVMIDPGYREENPDNWPEEPLEDVFGSGGFTDDDYDLVCVASGPDWPSVRKTFEAHEALGHQPMLMTRIPTKATHLVEAELNVESEEI